ncbi:hypothetical protein SAMN02745885_02037 [Carboxydocella sporoproducens DSM 16521]|uniref:Uncharacterized protein n=2 Tax=Carboxydocella TaxID=178898 RepID=A0A1T4RCS8_9FIRM|nr:MULTISPECIES: hypothetical protein [Carboxydocella]AVX20866.1 hypothetical protein CFE_1695 [Carboxydocella thermautotrophica]AVX31282.1 hypothetical protein CTH_1710 [Carboxydocella thermautotrophica]GAW29967.1 hypothetical protein ULO1_25370 [Carboxydocella sp. ULO1]SKA13616.1 hypothetical protein SAMN02745885_02037 [Carboxydocella sporoproducens DSM 16521]
MKDWLIVTNSFIHDTATGLWLAGLFLLGKIKASYGQDALFWELNTWVWLALVLILVTGALRGISFRYYGWTGDVARERKRLLLIKHGILGVVWTAGLIYHWQLLH